MLLTLTTSVCENPYVLGIIYFVKKLLSICFIIIPIGLILMMTLDLAKSVIAGKTDDMSKNVQLLGKRVLNCVILFLVPTLVNFTMYLISNVVGDNAVTSCYDNATLEKIKETRETYNSTIGQ